MLRINLLPREVLDRNRYSSWYRFVFIIAIGIAIALVIVAVGLNVLVQQKADQLQTAQDLAAKYEEQGKAFDVFERNEKDLADRQVIATTALAGRTNLGKVAEEISLILPDEVWLDSLLLDPKAGMSLIGNTPRSTSESLNQSYKSVARTLVRLNELPELSDVWLASAMNSSWSAWDTSSQTTSPTPVVKFTASAKVGPALVVTGTPAPVVDGR